MSERKTICPSCGFDRWKDKDPRGSENGASTLQAYETDLMMGYRADHDAEDRATLAEEGFPTMAAEKDVQSGIQAVTSLLTSKRGVRLKIFASCVNTIEELSVYSWAPPKEGRNAKEEPVKPGTVGGQPVPGGPQKSQGYR